MWTSLLRCCNKKEEQLGRLTVQRIKIYTFWRNSDSQHQIIHLMCLGVGNCNSFLKACASHILSEHDSPEDTLCILNLASFLENINQLFDYIRLCLCFQRNLDYTLMRSHISRNWAMV